MIIKKDGYLQDKLTQACYRIAQYMNLHIKEKEDQFTLKEAYVEDDKYWFDKKQFNKEDFIEFVAMCHSYTKYAHDLSLPQGKYSYKIDCPNCHRCTMTKQQLDINTITIGDSKYVICINCGEIMELI